MAVESNATKINTTELENVTETGSLDLPIHSKEKLQDQEIKKCLVYVPPQNIRKAETRPNTPSVISQNLKI